MKITIRSYFGMEIDVIDDTILSDIKGLSTNYSHFSIKNKSFVISDSFKIEKITNILSDRFEENKDITFFVKEEKKDCSYNILAFYNE
jgi:hypothetical protein